MKDSRPPGAWNLELSSTTSSVLISDAAKAFMPYHDVDKAEWTALSISDEALMQT